jgi:thiol:disulfide interchange protein DsbD
MVVLVLALGLAAGSVRAASTGRSRNVEVSLLAERESIQPGRPFRVGLRMRIADGWHTYWKNPGDAGLPARLKWTLPPGFVAGPIEWPVPDRIPTPPLMSYGYKDEVLLPVEMVAGPAPKIGEVTLSVKAEWLECREACLPGKAELDLTLPVRAQEAKPGPAAALFADVRQPAAPEGWSLSAEAGPRAIALSFRAPDGSKPAAAYFFPEDPKLTEHPAPQGFEPFGDGHRVTLKPTTAARPRAERLCGVLVVEGPGRPLAVKVDVPVAVGDPAPAVSGQRAVPVTGAAQARSLRLALLFAFVGGLLLNLMPCVLPVLSLKVLAFVRQANEKGSQTWRHGVVFTAGVVLSFWTLAGVLLLLRAGGQRVGWGFQLQSPPFVVVLSGLFLLLALSLFGVFDIGTSLVGAANLVTGRSGLWASFWNGALATVVATPCTAPFMGSALGFALSQPALSALGVFTSLGLGMAAPYLLLSLDPRLLRWVPKPGPWMEGFKQLMGFFLVGTVAALVWIFGRQVGVDGMGILLLALLVTALGGWVHGRGGLARTTRARVASALLALALMAAGLGIGLARAMAPPEMASALAPPTLGGIEWEEYSTVRLADLRGKGKPVFIDFTAAWCLTCQVNERVALGRPEVVARFRREGIVALRADWTRRDDDITAALTSYGREGVPVYVLYGREGAPRLLPEVLTPGLVLSAIDEVLGATSRSASVSGDKVPSSNDEAVR